MFGTVLAGLQRRADLLLAGNYREMAADYGCPIGFYHGDRVLAVRSTDEFVTLFAAVHMSLQRRGVLRLVPVVKAVELPRKGRQRLWVRWNQVAANPADSRAAEVIYYCRQTPGRLVTELVQYLQLGLPEMHEIAPDAVRTA